MNTASRTRDELTEQAANAAIEQACRILHLPTVRTGYDSATQLALRHQASYKTYLADLLAGECDEREARRKIRAVKAAGFPRLKRLVEFDFTANPAITPAVVHTLAGGEWIRQGRPLCLIGDSGTGKSHLLIGLGIAAAENGHRVRYTTAAALANELAEAADDRQLTRTIARYSRIDLLCLDELGYLRLDRRGAELLFQVITDREEKSSIAIASNSTFSEWAATFTDPRLCAAIVDRVTFNATIIETGTDSYRLTATRKTTSTKTKT
jgi:DNA replication protein DnaC